nr:DUF397 domain-containing protein [Kibdelosporangium sp. MJ126-NF4]CEL16961.1 hypothetical protein [Kibdelosporangium sp. MJ126-NF4]CTQ91810.1 hypothetical protein [Kibdelosporangium sp. MJ126-NF4]
MDLGTTRWRKSSHSGTHEDGSCVEVAIAAGSVGIRDTKNRAAGALVLPEHTWHALIHALNQ